MNRNIALHYILAGLCLLISLVVYSRTVAPTASFWDCGEFISCSYIMGVPHPPGAPLYVLLGRIFAMLPLWDDIGLRVNMFSVLVSSVTVMLTYFIIVLLWQRWQVPTREKVGTAPADAKSAAGPVAAHDNVICGHLGAFVGAMTLAFTDAYWFNAVESEVYALSLFFTVAIVWLILLWERPGLCPRNDRLLLLIAYLVGLALGVHLLSVLALGTVFLIIFFRTNQLTIRSVALLAICAPAAIMLIHPGVVNGIPWLMVKFSIAAPFVVAGLVILAIYHAIRSHRYVLCLVSQAALLIVVGYSTYAALYIRSNHDPLIDMNDPEEPARFASYLNREQYGDIPVLERRAPVWQYQIKKMYLRYFGWQFIGKGNLRGSDGFLAETVTLKGFLGLPFVLGLIGMAQHFRKDWPRALAFLTLFLVTGIILALYLNQADPQPRERDYAYTGSFFAFAVWVGLGAGTLLSVARGISLRWRQPMRAAVVGSVFAILIMAVPLRLLSCNYNSSDRTGNYVASDYSYNILQSCEPNAILFTNGDNDTYPIWYLQYVQGVRRDVRVVCLTLLNTPWYIKQLRDLAPRVPISYTDEQIERLQPMLWPEPRTVKIGVPADSISRYLRTRDSSLSAGQKVGEAGAVVFELAATNRAGERPIILVQDRMVLHILAENQFERPVYFSATVANANMLGLNRGARKPGHRNYLRMDGLAFQIMPYGVSGEFIAPHRMEENLLHEFRYRGLNDPAVHLDYRTQGLLQNYRLAFFKLANHYLRFGANARAADTLDQMQARLPETTLPIRNPDTGLMLAEMYYRAGRPDEMRRRLIALAARPLTAGQRLAVASFFGRYLNDFDMAESEAIRVIDSTANSLEVLDWLAAFFMRARQFQHGAAAIKHWMRLSQDSQRALAYLNKFERAIEDRGRGRPAEK